MKISKTFISHNSSGETLLVSTGASKFSGLVHSNETAGFIINCLETETSEDEIIRKVMMKYDAPREIVEKDVKKIISQLRKIGAIDD